MNSFNAGILALGNARDRNFSSWNDFKTFISYLVDTYKITDLDMMHCNIYNNPDWQRVIGYLTTVCNINIKSSDGLTGNTSMVAPTANWILEYTNSTQTPTNMVGLYFSDFIVNYKLTLEASSTFDMFDKLDDVLTNTGYNTKKDNNGNDLNNMNPEASSVLFQTINSSNSAYTSLTAGSNNAKIALGEAIGYSLLATNVMAVFNGGIYGDNYEDKIISYLSFPVLTIFDTINTINIKSGDTVTTSNTTYDILSIILETIFSNGLDISIIDAEYSTTVNSIIDSAPEVATKITNSLLEIIQSSAPLTPKYVKQSAVFVFTKMVELSFKILVQQYTDSNGHGNFSRENLDEVLSALAPILSEAINSFSPSSMLQNITFPAPVLMTGSSTVYRLSATSSAITPSGTLAASSGIPIQYTSSRPDIVRVDNTPTGWTATIIRDGFSAITASQAGSSRYFPVNVATKSLSINTQDKAISYSPSPSAGALIGTLNSQTITDVYFDTTSSVISTYATTYYNSSINIPLSISTITMTSATMPIYVFAVRGSTGLSLVFGSSSANLVPVSITDVFISNGNRLEQKGFTVNKKGDYTITINEPGTLVYAAADQVNISFRVNGMTNNYTSSPTQNITITGVGTATSGFVLETISGAKLSIGADFTISYSTQNIVSMASTGVITSRAIGQVIILLTPVSSDTYEDLPPYIIIVNVTTSVNSTILDCVSPQNVRYGDALTLSGIVQDGTTVALLTQPTLTYISTDTSIAEFAAPNSGVMTLKRAGIVSISILYAGDSTYQPSSKIISVNISKKIINAIPFIYTDSAHSNSYSSLVYGQTYYLWPSGLTGLESGDSIDIQYNVSTNGPDTRVLVRTGLAGNVQPFTIQNLSAGTPSATFTSWSNDLRYEIHSTFNSGGPINISKAGHNLGYNTPTQTSYFTGQSFSINPTSTTGTPTLTFTNSNASETVSGSGIVSLNSSGDVDIKISIPGTNNYYAMPSAQSPSPMFTVNVISQGQGSCFPEKTPITCDQGLIEIDKINPAIHTINNKKILAVSKTIYEVNKLVCFEKHSLYKNVPSQTTLMTKDHCVFYNGKMVEAKSLIGLNDNIYEKTHKYKFVYNILMEKYDKMRVNNLIVDTLHPESKIAKYYAKYGYILDKEFEDIMLQLAKQIQEQPKKQNVKSKK